MIAAFLGIPIALNSTAFVSTQELERWPDLRYSPLMAIQRELTLRLANSPGTLSRVAEVLGNERINMLAMSLDATGTLRMVVDNPLHAAGSLRDQHYIIEERDVLYATMPNDPGSLGRVAKLLADAGINLDYAYASGIDRVPMVAVVVGVNDAQRASAATGI
jgi:hypothetical protein